MNRYLPFAHKGWFSGFAVFSVGFLSAFPALPEIAPETFAAKANLESVSEKKPENQEERCRWQKDVAFFSALEDGGQIGIPDETACEKKREAAGSPVIAKQIHKNKEGDNELDQKIRELAVGYPLEVMAPAIARYDREVAALIVGIAKKESNWGKRVPLDANGADCFNYWGWKGAGSRGVAMGHGCFGSPEEAVEAVGNRLAKLVAIRQTSEPKNLIVWKCGSSCATHSPESVRKWVSDVDIYYKQIAGK